MCGIAGFIDSSVRYPEQVLKQMTDMVANRGPDDKGYWCDPNAGVGLGHRRLSILDLTSAGHQPMRSASGRYVIVLNGEIYNYMLMRADLERSGTRNWRGHSDTEVILEAIESWGVETAVKRSIGMFAMAIWDRKERALHLVRDRIGEKPIYYGFFGDAVIFGSQLKALRMHPAFKGEIDRKALALYMRYCYIPTPYTIYKGVFKLIPGTIITVVLDGRKIIGSSPTPYWSLHKVAQHGIEKPFQGTDKEAVSGLESLLSDAISKQMITDVPLGVFLSGGIDSSVVVALMRKQSPKKVKTFTIGFADRQYDEAVHAKEVARHLGTDHTELYVSADDALGVVPVLSKIYDEPFGDSSQIPTFLISQMAKRYVTVSLSGDAGDELFGGYNRYLWGKRVWNSVGWIPRNIRRITANHLVALSPQAWDRLFGILGAIVPLDLRQRTLGDKIHKLAGMLDAESHAEMYYRQVSTWKNPASIMAGVTGHPTVLDDDVQRLDTKDFVNQMMYLDLITYLPDDILVKVDRAAMALALESRMPFLDHRVVEFACKLPLSLKIRYGQGKWILRQVLNRYVPKKLIERPKMGFAVPMDAWLRGSLREWAEAMLSESRLKQEGFFNPQPIRELWNEHLNGGRNWQHHIWNVLMFQAWLENQDEAAAPLASRMAEKTS